ncbi:MAG: DUF2024 family protein [Bifidobacteriaceae bacterium]|nr:DUF2024 family protein [Bifidobacteriaceae bacterium]
MRQKLWLTERIHQVTQITMTQASFCHINRQKTKTQKNVLQK